LRPSTVPPTQFLVRAMEHPEPRPVPEPVRAGDLDWRALFEARSPREVLARLVEGDPLRLRERCAQRVRSQALLLDVQRLQLRTVAHVARHAGTYRGTPPLDVWIAERVRKALTELLDEDEARRSLRDIPELPSDQRLLAVANVLGIEPEVLARGLSVFNRAPSDVRSAFCEMVLDGVSPAEWSAANGFSVERAKAAVRRALWILGVREDLDVDDLLAGTDDGGDDDP